MTLAPTELPSQEDFANIVADYFFSRNEKIEGELKLDRRQYSFVISDGQGRVVCQVLLTNYYNEYCREINPVNREEILMRATNGLIRRSNLSLREIETIKSRLLIQVKDRWSIEMWRLKLKMGVGGGKSSNVEIPHAVVAEHFALLATYDMPEQMMYVTSSQLDEWGLEYLECFEQGCANLFERTQFDFESFMDTSTNESLIHKSMWQDEYDSARIVFSDNLMTLPVSGERLIVLHNNNLMTVSGTDSQAGIAFLMMTMEEESKKPRSLPPVPILMRDGVFSSYRVPRQKPLLRFLETKHLDYVQQVYAWQRQALEGEFNQLVAGWRVIPLQADTSNKAKWPFTHCSITSGRMPALVPKADIVYFGPSHKPQASLRWDAFVKAFAPLLEETDHYPELHLLKTYPSQQEIASIGFVLDL